MYGLSCMKKEIYNLIEVPKRVTVHAEYDKTIFVTQVSQNQFLPHLEMIKII